MPARSLRWFSAVIAALAACAISLAPAASAAPRCFGAAARDPEHQPCTNAALRSSVVPSPGDATLMPNSRCTPVRSSRAPAVCSFGAPARGAVATVALVGDSHAVHWRAAVDVAARARRWHGLSVTFSRCAFSIALPKYPGPQCVQWRSDVVQWFARHPEVSVAIMSAHAGFAVAAGPGQDRFEVATAGYLDAWNLLPPTVKRIVVVRDVPNNEVRTLGCVERVIERHRPTRTACAVPRAVALKPDPMAAAAARAPASRVGLVDLTPLMCDVRRCFPVIGGVLVHKDVGHLTRTFSATLGPFLLRALDRVLL